MELKNKEEQARCYRKAVWPSIPNKGGLNYEQMDPEFIKPYKPMTALEIVESFRSDLTEEQYKELMTYFEYNTLQRKRLEVLEQLDKYNKNAEYPLTPDECYYLGVKKPHWNDEISEDEEE